MSSDQSASGELAQLIRAEGLPAEFLATVNHIYRPLAAALAQQVATTGFRAGRPLMVGVNGAQGTGKSTLARFLVLLLARECGLRAVAFSLDDIYLTRRQRLALAETVHPLLAVRGVPGTHDLALGEHTLNRLSAAAPRDLTPIPAFDKATDDRLPETDWPSFQGRPDVVILEGWCVGARPQAEDTLALPVNDLERHEDPGGRWRSFVNHHLATDYGAFFARLDVLVHLAAPGWEVVQDWRMLQEEKLANRCRASGLDDTAVMTPGQVARFIQFYERVTRHTLAEMPARADFVLPLDRDHRILALRPRAE